MSKKNNPLKGVAAVLASSVLIESCDIGVHMRGLDIESVNIAVQTNDCDNSSVCVLIDLDNSIFFKPNYFVIRRVYQ